MTFPYLVSSTMLPWISDTATSPQYREDGVDRTARNIMDNLEMYNRMISEPETMWCPQSLCDAVDGFCDRDEEEEDGMASLSARRVEWEQKVRASIYLGQKNADSAISSSAMFFIFWRRGQKTKK